MASNTCPPLPSGSIDFNAINAAAAKGENLAEALAKQVAKPEAKKPMADVKAPANTPPIPAAERA